MASVKLFACGDMFISKLKTVNLADLALQKVIQSCDISICNFEGAIRSKNSKPIKKAGPHLHQARDAIAVLKKTGFNWVSLANNHIYDYGQEALDKTIRELKNHKVNFVGGGENFEQAYQTKVIEKNGLKIGLIACCENEFGCLFENKKRGGYAWIFHSLIEDNITILKKQCDFIVLIAHAGVEEIEIPIKEWRDKYKRFCEMGVNVVIGHHPHVPQGYEKHKESIIFYSLGNFYFDTNDFKNKGDDSYSVLLEIDKTGLQNFETIFHKKRGGQTCQVSSGDVNFSLPILNSYLNENYVAKNNAICVELFRRYYFGYYETALSSFPRDGLIAILKYIIKKKLLNNKNIEKNGVLLLHNIRIDSHRFVVQRALSLLYE